jgi:type IV fimbrial biogenesis protein FimT
MRCFHIFNHRPIGQSRAPFLRQVAGFTLIELMITITVGAVLLAVGMPSFRDFVAGQRVKTAGYDLSTALLMARSEAIKRNANVTVEPKSATNWVSGWSVLFGGAVINDQVPYTGLTITRGSTDTDTITFARTGRPTSRASFTIAGGASVRCVQLDLTGLPSTKNGACT